MALQSAFQITGSSLIGTTLASLAGANPLIGAGMAAAAYLATCVAAPALSCLPNLEDHEFFSHQFLATVCVIAAWCASIAQITQIAALALGYTISFPVAAGIVATAVLLGPNLGNWIYQNVMGESSEAF